MLSDHARPSCAPPPDKSPKRDIFNILILPNNPDVKHSRLAAQLKKDGFLYWPGGDKPILHDDKPVKIGENETCKVTVC